MGKRLNRIWTLMGVVFLVAGAFTSYHLVRHMVAVDVYRDRLQGLSEEYEDLRATYNAAVKRSAVTELVVKEGKLSVVVRTIEGVLKEIPTPFDPTRDEIHVDFVVVDGRLWIRRVMHIKPPDAREVVIDPKLTQVNWDLEGNVYGVTIYRPLSEGRWVVNATTNGALTLVRKKDGEEIKLIPPPPVRQFEEIQKEVDTKVGEISARDVYNRLIGKP